jgi:hypothetical protein
MNTTSNKWAGIFGAVAMVGAGLAACTGDLGGSDLDGDSGSGSNSGSGANSGSGVGGFDGSGSTGSSTGGGNECAALEVTPQLVPVSMFITDDKSGSMSNNNKWNNALAAFSAFFTDPSADNLNVAMRFWPDGGCDTSCNFGGCAVAQVDMGSLGDPAHEQALISTFQSKSPGGLTPMEAALAGAEQYALNFQTSAEAGSRIVVVLLTDGEPTACNQNINVIAQYAADAYAQAEILTFAVGLEGSNTNDMNTIAAAGQTGMGYFIGNGNAQADLLQALKDIQEIAVACSYAIPESPDPTMPTDPNQVNVYYKDNPNAPGELVAQVADAAGCTANGGWYYDDPSDPKIINLCPATCDIANANETSGVSIKIGCQTIVQ